MTVSELVTLFKSLNPAQSRQEIALREFSSFKETVEEFAELNQELLLKTFFGGYKLGTKDEEIFVKILNKPID